MINYITDYTVTYFTFLNILHIVMVAWFKSQTYNLWFYDKYKFFSKDIFIGFSIKDHHAQNIETP
jgi:hypothetical protein